MTIDFYYMTGSPPCTVISIILAELGIESQVNRHLINVEAKEHLTEEYAKKNPQRKAPTIVDDGFALSESRAIAKYLVAKYGNNKYYPQDIKARALIDQRLDFDIGTLYPKLFEVYKSTVLGLSLSEDQRNKTDEAFTVLNNILGSSEYVAGAEPSLADISLALTALVCEAFKINMKQYPNTSRWLTLVRSTIPKFENIAMEYVKFCEQLVSSKEKSQ